MPTPGLPLPLRNALAELAIAALEHHAAVAALEWLARPEAPIGGVAATRLAEAHLIDPGAQALLAVHAPHSEAVKDHAARALRAARSHRADARPASDSCSRALAAAVALWNEQLFFEVHEVLEAVWKTASGDVRQALQGVIQIAVAYHHLAHGNRRGARTLLHEGRERLAATPTALAGIDAPALLSATAPWESALASGSAPPDRPPALVRAVRSEAGA